VLVLVQVAVTTANGACDQRCSLSRVGMSAGGGGGGLKQGEGYEEEASSDSAVLRQLQAAAARGLADAVAALDSATEILGLGESVSDMCMGY
jgi:hypothetical protein